MLKIKLETSKQGHGWGGLLQASSCTSHPLAGEAGGKVGEAQCMKVKVTASHPAMSQPLSHKPMAQGLLRWLPLEQPTHSGPRRTAAAQRGQDQAGIHCHGQDHLINNLTGELPLSVILGQVS